MISEVYSLPEIKGKKVHLHVPKRHYLNKNNDTIIDNFLKLNTRYKYYLLYFVTNLSI
jgi:hypothetical protein